LVDVICDTSFLIHLATRKISNLDSINTEIGQIQLVVPTVVLNELKRLANVKNKKQDAMTTLEFAHNLKHFILRNKFFIDIIFILIYLFEQAGFLYRLG